MLQSSILFVTRKKDSIENATDKHPLCNKKKTIPLKVLQRSTPFVKKMRWVFIFLQLLKLYTLIS